MNCFRISILFALTAFLSGCMIFPYGSEVTQKDIDRIEIGKTTNRQIIKLLGRPNVTETERIHVYHLREGRLFVGFLKEAHVVERRKHSLTIVYDEEGVVMGYTHFASDDGKRNKPSMLGAPIEVLTDIDTTYSRDEINGVSISGSYKFSLSNTGRYISKFSKNEITIYDTQSLEVVLSQSVDHVIESVFNNDDTTLAIHVNGTIYCWSLSDKSLISTLIIEDYSYGAASSRIALSTDGNVVAVARDKLLMMDVKSGVILSDAKLDYTISHMQFSYDDNYLLALGMTGPVPGYNKVNLYGKALGIVQEFKVGKDCKIFKFTETSPVSCYSGGVFSSQNNVLLITPIYIGIWDELNARSDSAAQPYGLSKVIPTEFLTEPQVYKQMALTDNAKIMAMCGLSSHFYAWDLQSGTPIIVDSRTCVPMAISKQGALILLNKKLIADREKLVITRYAIN